MGFEVFPVLLFEIDGYFITVILVVVIEETTEPPILFNVITDDLM